MKTMKRNDTPESEVRDSVGRETEGKEGEMEGEKGAGRQLSLPPPYPPPRPLIQISARGVAQGLKRGRLSW